MPPLKQSSAPTAILNASRWGDLFGFFKAGLMQPRRVGSVMPSSGALARLITQEIDPDAGPVIELGPGTGVFTSALLARGVAPSALALVESDTNLAARLQRRYPEVQVLCMDAGQLADVVLFGGGPARAVISGVPLLSLPRREVIHILRSAFSHMAPDGAFYQFTYGPVCPVPAQVMNALELHAQCIGRTFANIPPASVFRFTRRS